MPLSQYTWLLAWLMAYDHLILGGTTLQPENHQPSLVRNVMNRSSGPCGHCLVGHGLIGDLPKKWPSSMAFHGMNHGHSAIGRDKNI